MTDALPDFHHRPRHGRPRVLDTVAPGSEGALHVLHTPGSIRTHARERGLLFTGDHIGRSDHISTASQPALRWTSRHDRPRHD